MPGSYAWKRPLIKSWLCFKKCTHWFPSVRGQRVLVLYMCMRSSFIGFAASRWPSFILICWPGVGTSLMTEHVDLCAHHETSEKNISDSISPGFIWDSKKGTLSGWKVMASPKKKPRIMLLLLSITWLMIIKAIQLMLTFDTCSYN